MFKLIVIKFQMLFIGYNYCAGQ
uniref:Uncharacterized protein n=1 Tax=Arundo donax TaxID=35708 RepID=A0A0A8XYJ6_ARUDO